MHSAIPYLCCCLVLSLVIGSDCFKPVVYPARVTEQCGQPEAAILDDQLMETLRNIQQQLYKHTAATVYLDCKDVYLKGQTTSGIYTIKPDNQTAFQVYCDMETDGGGWTVFQRRMDGSVDFYRNWTDYEQGFGNLSGEYWLGLRKIHRLTPNASQELRVDLGDFENNTRYAHYGTFSVAGTSDNYRLLVLGYSGSAGDSLINHHSGSQFSTRDRDNDNYSGNCAVIRKGGWWYNICQTSNLNGLYHSKNLAQSSWAIGINWTSWRGYGYSLRFTEMKLRRK